jgi:hypothetical protein
VKVSLVFAVLTAAFPLAILPGCGRAEIHSYRVPKSAQAPKGADALLASGAGTAPASSDQAAARGVSWSVPSGWKEVPTTQQMRLATFDANGVEVAVSAFPGAVGGTLANVNRWRGQIGLDAIDEAGLGELLVTSREGPTDVSLLVMEGKDGRVMLGAIIVPGDGQTWFVKATTDAAKATALRGSFGAFSRSFRLASDAAGDTKLAASAPAVPAAQPATQPATRSGSITTRLARYKAPEGWATESSGGNIVAAAFKATNDGGGARITATSLGNDGGGDLANINRWRGQLGLAPLADLAAVERSDLVPGLVTVDLRNAEGTDRMISVIAPAGGSTWFFKMRGTVAGVEAERAKFAAFVREVAQGTTP